MKILYVAKHNSGGNDDEGAIRHALIVSGHQVTCLTEDQGDEAVRTQDEHDLLLFHKWEDFRSMRAVAIPKVFWYFDLVTYADQLVVRRCLRRVEWMRTVTPIVNLGFCTDGDWVAQDRSGKLVVLRQGADIRYAGVMSHSNEPAPIILFTGISKGGGLHRMHFVQDMAAHYKSDFTHIASGVHGLPLRSLVQCAKIVVAPNAPVTDHYWSNRVYLTLGYGGFLMHPRASDLEKEYEDGKELVYYSTMKDLYSKIGYYLSHEDEKEKIRQAGLFRTLRDHTYTHRVQKMIEVIRTRLIGA